MWTSRPRTFLIESKEDTLYEKFRVYFITYSPMSPNRHLRPRHNSVLALLRKKERRKRAFPPPSSLPLCVVLPWGGVKWASRSVKTSQAGPGHYYQTSSLEQYCILPTKEYIIPDLQTQKGQRSTGSSGPWSLGPRRRTRREEGGREGCLLFSALTHCSLPPCCCCCCPPNGVGVSVKSLCSWWST